MHSKNHPAHVYISVLSLHFPISHYYLNYSRFVFYRGLCTAWHPFLVIPIHSPFAFLFRFILHCFKSVYYTSILFATVSHKMQNTCIKISHTVLELIIQFSFHFPLMCPQALSQEQVFSHSLFITIIFSLVNFVL